MRLTFFCNYRLCLTGNFRRRFNRRNIIPDFDITYKDAAGVNVAAKDITETQRQKLADYYGYVLKSYMTKIPNEKQAGISKGNIADTGDPVGLWAVTKSKDWVRTATYKAFCDALSGK